MFQLGIESRRFEIESNQFGVESHPITPVIHPWLALFPFFCFIWQSPKVEKSHSSEWEI